MSQEKTNMSRSVRPDRCEDCGARNPYMVFIDWDAERDRWACEHRYACEARMMLAAGASSEAAAAHAQQRRPW